MAITSERTDPRMPAPDSTFPRLTKPKHSWSNSQNELTARIIKEATVRRFHFDNHQRFRRYFGNFVAAYNFDFSLNNLKRPTSYECIFKV